MKKIFFTAAIALMATGICNAQWYVGGNLSFSTTGGKNTAANGTEVKIDPTMEFGIAPKVGYIFNDKWLVGAELGYNYRMDKTVATDTKITTNGFGIRPYARYNFVRMGSFAIGAEAGLGFTYGMTKSSAAPDIKSTGMGISVGIAPVVSFDISPRIMLETRLDVFSLTFNNVTTKVDSNGSVAKNNTNDFGFNVNSDNLFSLGNITFGFVYKF